MAQILFEHKENGLTVEELQQVLRDKQAFITSIPTVDRFIASYQTDYQTLVFQNRLAKHLQADENLDLLTGLVTNLADFNKLIKAFPTHAPAFTQILQTNATFFQQVIPDLNALEKLIARKNYGYEKFGELVLNNDDLFGHYVKTVYDINQFDLMFESQLYDQLQAKVQEQQLRFINNENDRVELQDIFDNFVFNTNAPAKHVGSKAVPRNGVSTQLENGPNNISPNDPNQFNATVVINGK